MPNPYLPELNLALADPDNPLTPQFSSILNLAGIFGLSAPLDAAVSFYAPLRSNLNDLRGAPFAFERGSDALYKAAASWQIASPNVARFVDNRLLMEPAITNKCTGYSDGSALDNITLAGNTGATLRQVTDLEASALFGAVLSTGQVFEIDATNGLGSVDVNVAGAAGNTEAHTLSAFCRVMQPGDVGHTLRDAASALPAVAVSALDWTRVTTSGTAAAGTAWQLRCENNGIVRFVLCQLEETGVPTTPIITRGAAASRDVDVLNYTGNAGPQTLLTANPGLDNFADGWVVGGVAGACASVERLASSVAIANHTGVTCSVARREDVTFKQGSWYHVRVAVSFFAATSGHLEVVLGNVTTGKTIQGTGTHDFFYFMAAAPTNTHQQINAMDPVSMWAEIDYFAVSEVAGAVNHAQGVLVLDWYPKFAATVGVPGTQGLVSLFTIVESLLYHDVTFLQSFDQTNTAQLNLPNFAADDRVRCVVRWQAGELDLGHYHNGTWTWMTTPAGYDGLFDPDELIRIAYGLTLPMGIGNAQMYRENKSRAWIEDNLTP